VVVKVSINKSLLKRIEKLEVTHVKDPELLAKKIAQALGQMVMRMPYDFSGISSEEFGEIRHRVLQGHHGVKRLPAE
jgi:hypothetical protein